MDTLLVVSDEPALGQALREALVEYNVVSARAGEFTGQLAAQARLVIAEKAVAETITSRVANDSMLVVTRPVRLRELLYTIGERLQAQTLAIREEIPLSRGYRYLLRERCLAAQDGAMRITLTEKEGELFLIFLEHKGTTLQRDELLRRVWGYHADADTHTLETHIYRLRGKLRQMEAGYDILTQGDGGYQMVNVD